MYRLELLESTAALRTFPIDLRPVFDAVAVKVVLTWREDRPATLFLFHQADRADFLAFCVLFDILELIELALVGHSHLVLNGILIIKGLNQSHSSFVLFSLLDDPPLHLKPSQREEEILPANELMHELYINHKDKYEVKNEDDPDGRREAQLAA